MAGWQVSWQYQNMLEKIGKHVSSIIACIICFALGVGVCLTIYKTNTNPELEKFNTVYKILKNKWYYSDTIDDETLVEQALSGMVNFSEDPHTNYFSLEQAKLFSSSLEGSNVGIGLSFYSDVNNNMVCRHIFMDSPAQKANLQPGDVLIQINDMVCSESDTADVISYIKENENKELKVLYLRDNKQMETTITPSSYDSTVVCEIYDDYGYIILNSFSQNSAKYFNLAMQQLKEKGIKKMVLDLRDDTGGYLTSVLDIASCLLEKDSPVFIEKQKDKDIVQKSSNEYDRVEMNKIVILQNENTASAAEVLIGALKDNLNDVVTTVGTTTYGKGTEQVSIPFDDGTSIKYTIAQWVTPKGTSMNKVGFEPDVKIENNKVSSVQYKQMEDDEQIVKDNVHVNAQALQLYLQFLGYEVDRTDTYFSPTSSKALEQYQIDHNLESTGNCDADTFKKIQADVLLKINEMNLDSQYDKAISLITE